MNELKLFRGKDGEVPFNEAWSSEQKVDHALSSVQYAVRTAMYGLTEDEQLDLIEKIIVKCDTFKIGHKAIQGDIIGVSKENPDIVISMVGPEIVWRNIKTGDLVFSMFTPSESLYQDFITNHVELLTHEQKATLAKQMASRPDTSTTSTSVSGKEA